MEKTGSIEASTTLVNMGENSCHDPTVTVRDFATIESEVTALPSEKPHLFQGMERCYTKESRWEF
jgi:hypothetical protein